MFLIVRRFVCSQLFFFLNSRQNKGAAVQDLFRPVNHNLHAMSGKHHGVEALLPHVMLLSPEAGSDFIRPTSPVHARITPKE